VRYGRIRSALIFGMLIALPGCYIPSGMYRVTAKVTSAHTASGRCHTEERADGWTIITCPEDESRKPRPKETR